MYKYNYFNITCPLGHHHDVMPTGALWQTYAVWFTVQNCGQVHHLP